MTDNSERLIQAALSRAKLYTQLGRGVDPAPGSFGEYYQRFHAACDVGQDAYIMQEMSDPEGHAVGLRNLVRGSDPDAPGQAAARVAGYLVEYLKINLGNSEDFLAYLAADEANFKRELDSMLDEAVELDRQFQRLYRKVRTKEDLAALNRMLEARIERAAADERAALRRLKELQQSRWKPPNERLAELVEQAPAVFAGQDFPPELRLLASRALLRGKGYSGPLALEIELSLSNAERKELLQPGRYPLVDPTSGGVIAMTAASPRAIEMFLVTGREPGNIPQLVRDLNWSEREATRFSELQALVVSPGEPPVPAEERSQGSLLTVVRVPTTRDRNDWLASERDSFEFWASWPNADYTVIARRGSGVRTAIGHGLLAPRRSGGNLLLQPFGQSAGTGPELPEHVGVLPALNLRLTDLVLGVPDLYSPRWDEGLPYPSLAEELGVLPHALVRPASPELAQGLSGDDP